MKTSLTAAEIWRTNNDTAVSIKELETSHLMNIVRDAPAPPRNRADDARLRY